MKAQNPWKVHLVVDHPNHVWTIRQPATLPKSNLSFTTISVKLCFVQDVNHSRIRMKKSNWYICLYFLLSNYVSSDAYVLFGFRIAFGWLWKFDTFAIYCGSLEKPLECPDSVTITNESCSLFRSNLVDGWNWVRNDICNVTSCTAMWRAIAVLQFNETNIIVFIRGYISGSTLMCYLIAKA